MSVNDEDTKKEDESNEKKVTDKEIEENAATQMLKLKDIINTELAAALGLEKDDKSLEAFNAKMDGWDVSIKKAAEKSKSSATETYTKIGSAVTKVGSSIVDNVKKFKSGDALQIAQGVLGVLSTISSCFGQYGSAIGGGLSFVSGIIGLFVHIPSTTEVIGNMIKEQTKQIASMINEQTKQIGDMLEVVVKEIAKLLEKEETDIRSMFNYQTDTILQAIKTEHLEDIFMKVSGTYDLCITHILWMCDVGEDGLSDTKKRQITDKFSEREQVISSLSYIIDTYCSQYVVKKNNEWEIEDKFEIAKKQHDDNDDSKNNDIYEKYLQSKYMHDSSVSYIKFYQASITKLLSVFSSIRVFDHLIKSIYSNMYPNDSYVNDFERDTEKDSFMFIKNIYYIWTLELDDIAQRYIKQSSKCVSNPQKALNTLSKDNVQQLLHMYFDKKHTQYILINANDATDTINAINKYHDFNAKLFILRDKYRLDEKADNDDIPTNSFGITSILVFSRCNVSPSTITELVETHKYTFPQILIALNSIGIKSDNVCDTDTMLQHLKNDTYPDLEWKKRYEIFQGVGGRLFTWQIGVDEKIFNHNLLRCTSMTINVKRICTLGGDKIEMQIYGLWKNGEYVKDPQRKVTGKLDNSNETAEGKTFVYKIEGDYIKYLEPGYEFRFIGSIEITKDGVSDGQNLAVWIISVKRDWVLLPDYQ